MCYKQLGCFELAVQDFSQALKHSQNDKLDVICLSNRANSYTCLGLFPDSLSDLNSAINKLKHSPILYCNRGTTYYKMGDLEKARADYVQACNLDPTYAISYYNIGLIDAQLGRIQSSTDCFIYSAHLFAKLSRLGDQHVADCIRHLRRNLNNPNLSSLSQLPALAPQSSVYQLASIPYTASPLPLPLPPTSALHDVSGVVKMGVADMLLHELQNHANAMGISPPTSPSNKPASSPKPSTASTSSYSAYNNPYRQDPSNPFNNARSPPANAKSPLMGSTQPFPIYNSLHGNSQSNAVPPTSTTLSRAAQSYSVEAPSKHVVNARSPVAHVLPLPATSSHSHAHPRPSTMFHVDPDYSSRDVPLDSSVPYQSLHSDSPSPSPGSEFLQVMPSPQSANSPSLVVERRRMLPNRG